MSKIHPSLSSHLRDAANDMRNTSVITAIRLLHKTANALNTALKRTNETKRNLTAMTIIADAITERAEKAEAQASELARAHHKEGSQ